MNPRDRRVGASRSESQNRIPLSIKIGCTLWAIVLVPIWIDVQGLHNFLWISDIALLGTCAALWLESRLLTSMMAVGAVLPDLGWLLQYLGRLAIDAGPLERSGFMFDEDLPLFVRGLSLFHVFLPLLLVWMTGRLGYDRRALRLQTLLAWVVLVVSYLVTPPNESVNFVYGFGSPPQPPIPQPWWLAAQMLILLLAAHLPMHLLLKRWAAAGECVGPADNYRR